MRDVLLDRMAREALTDKMLLKESPGEGAEPHEEVLGMKSGWSEEHKDSEAGAESPGVRETGDDIRAVGARIHGALEAFL